ncbi:hypothetical protein D9619_013661 [Psilocybe cf. subviscida]|uniref:Uncharacterized protein n=1 Tax=Psilocybe cf. subviscida TaxID=2480587 RepID=A0A8H5F8W5_9AGAR|nr:hypothetical protein D9619_013661 [Psilocybe cf. subviscida]
MLVLSDSHPTHASSTSTMTGCVGTIRFSPRYVAPSTGLYPRLPFTVAELFKRRASVTIPLQRRAADWTRVTSRTRNILHVMDGPRGLGSFVISRPSDQYPYQCASRYSPSTVHSLIILNPLHKFIVFDPYQRQRLSTIV